MSQSKPTMATGVIFLPTTNTWSVSINHAGKRYSLGTFKHELEAHKAQRIFMRAIARQKSTQIATILPARKLHSSWYTSKYRGVKWNAMRWQATIEHQKKRIRLGVFATEEEAAEAYNARARELRGQKSSVNEVSQLTCTFAPGHTCSLLENFSDEDLLFLRRTTY